jgi:8-oxo-dGTP diphosphatase
MENNPTWLPVVAAALQRQDGAWLMHKRPAEKQHGGLWEFPGGKVEIGETPEKALVRELSEELGIAVNGCDLQPAFFAQEAMAGKRLPIVILLYTLRIWTGDPAGIEGGAIGWFTVGQVLKLDKPPLDVDLASKLFEKECG